MRKIVLALVMLAAVLCPLAAGESWVGLSTGPGFRISDWDVVSETVTDFAWDVNVEGAYYFDEAETLGIGARLALGFTHTSTYRPGYPIENGMRYFDNPLSGTRIAPAVTFQYRLGLTDSLDLRFSAGLQYACTIGNPVSISVSTPLGNGKYQYYSYYENNTVHSFDVIASADAAYSFGDVQVYGGVDIGISLASSFSKRVETNGTVTNGGDSLSGFAMSVTPRFGVSYAF